MSKENLCYEESIHRCIPNLVVGKVYDVVSIMKVNSGCPGKYYSWSKQPAIYIGKKDHLLYFKQLSQKLAMFNDFYYISTAFLQDLFQGKIDIYSEADIKTDELYLNAFKEVQVPNDNDSEFSRRYYSTRYIQTFQIPVSDEELNYNWSPDPCRVRSIYNYGVDEPLPVEFCKYYKFKDHLFDEYSTINIVTSNDAAIESFEISNVDVSDTKIKAGNHCINIEDIVSGEIAIFKNTIVIHESDV